MCWYMPEYSIVFVCVPDLFHYTNKLHQPLPLQNFLASTYFSFVLQCVRGQSHCSKMEAFQL